MKIKNRYDNLLRIHNQKINSLGAPFKIFWHEASYEIKKFCSSNKRVEVLEIGSGEGDSGLPILLNTNCDLHLLDISKEMIASSKKLLKGFEDRVKYICKDVIEYLSNTHSYKVIYSSFTLHNFSINDQERVVSLIYQNLDLGGIFVWDDLISPKIGLDKIVKQQFARYSYLEPKIRKNTIEHMKKDLTKKYEIKESRALEMLKKVGFKKVTILDRIEREVLIIAQK
jgi:ubiquinone/menaquinone biosynthesis C-methylase UbiE